MGPNSHKITFLDQIQNYNAFQDEKSPIGKKLIELEEDEGRGIVNIFYMESYKLRNATWDWSDHENKHKNSTCECTIF